MNTAISTKNRPSKALFSYRDVYAAQIHQSGRLLTSASVFSGVRGLDIGARKAGFTAVFQSDFWTEGGRAFHLNIPVQGDTTHPEHLHSEGVYVCGPEKGNICNLTYPLMQEYLNSYLGLSIPVGGLDIFHGGPPCQGFSKSNNKRGPGIEKNYLIFQMLRIVSEAKPRVVLIEQVPDILSPKFRQIWDRVKATLAAMPDYTWDARVMNAKDYGARQSRKRAIIMLVRRDVGSSSFPAPSAPDLSKVSVNSLLPHVFHFSPGQFADTIKCARKHVFCTMTATGSELFYGIDGKRRAPQMWERLVLTELEGLKLDGISFTNQKKLVGNMVQVSFAEALFRHVRTHILRA
jgi:site-specific DNA-cytosine methylase